MRKGFWLPLMLAAFIVPGLCKGQTVQVDFSEQVSPPLIKTKFGVYQTPLASTDRLHRDLPLLSELGARTLRYETAWGKDIAFEAPQITGSGTDLNYDRAEYTRFLKDVMDQGAYPLVTHGYNPPPFIEPGKDWRSKPTDLEAWREINRDYASYWRAEGIDRISYEIWNEPDLEIFSTFSQADYFQIYNAGARGVRAGDADAKVGGPVAAFTTWHEDFLQYVRARQLPFDFLSGHAYGDAGKQIQAMQNALGPDEWPMIEMYLTEYASYPTNPPDDIQPGGDIERYVAAADFLEDAKEFLSYTALTKVYWAQWSDVTFLDDNSNWFLPADTDKMGFIDVSGNVKAIYNAFKIYNELPVDRKEVSVSGQGLDAMASSDAHNAGVVIWSEQEENIASASLQLDDLPFATGTAELYRIDEDHASYYENPESADLSVLRTLPVADHSLNWSGSIPVKGVVYLKLSDDTEKSELEPHAVANVIRTHHWFRDRGNTHYANFDPETWIARLGMGVAKDYADALVGATIENLPTALDVNISTAGELKDLNENSILGVRIDYQDVGGEFVKSVLYHGDVYSGERTSEWPWGTQKQADEAVAVENLSQFSIEVAEQAPESFRGRAILSFRLQNTGKRTQAEIKVRSGSSMTIPVEEPEEPEEDQDLPEQYDLGSNYPNPFSSSTTITYDLPAASHVRIGVYDLRGRRVTTLVEEQKTAGSHEVQLKTPWLASGLYFYRLEAGDFSETKKMIIIK